jgi:hypothetical protein
VSPIWLTAFVDLPAERYEDGAAFWEGVTGYRRSAPRGEDGQFATLVPPAGQDHLRLQRVDRLVGHRPRIHLDLHVEERPAAVAEAVGLGATIAAEPYDDVTILHSPHGMVFCLVTGGAGDRTPPAEWPDGHTSLVDQVCLDIPPASYDEECAFWQRLTGWELSHREGSEFSSLVRPAGMPLRLLLQRLDDGDGPVTAHLDLATTDRSRETPRHESLGATVLRSHDFFTVLRDPAGSVYCITDRDPGTGLIG